LLLIVAASYPFHAAPDGNSQKNHNNQPKVVYSICDQLAAGNRNITGVMIESHINAGRQDVPDEGAKALKHGVSITDACVDWAVTIEMLTNLNEVSAVHMRICSY
jgi:3-deoxy-7-phosphoheptulonate synthase